jgi:hypothetical protein
LWAISSRRGIRSNFKKQIVNNKFSSQEINKCK